ncbi:hypothetical protein [Kitasatospora aureofaciens]|uniref:hypothetical protein n=1 Tax=Kitasatospora aureofaciens TaxID=1894 RepID=UPI001C43FBFB|nr:hypothetical protein [Kitasatospora aureofaciens]MBV6698178.1 hypothetical protein [Kitasatospora aureofaciens]
MTVSLGAPTCEFVSPYGDLDRLPLRPQEYVPLRSARYEEVPEHSGASDGPKPQQLRLAPGPTPRIWAKLW